MVFTATNIIGVALTCGIGIIAVAAYHILAYYNNMRCVVNQIYKLSDELEKMMSEKRAHFNNEQERLIKACEYVLLISVIFSTFTPLGYGIFFTSEREPVHQLFREWLDIEVNLDFHSLPIILLFMWAALAGGGAAFLVIYVVVLYIFFALTCISSLSPTNIYIHVMKAGERVDKYTIDTTSFGLMGEQEAILAYRTQQLITVYMNEIFASVLISLHQVALMVILVGTSFMLITVSKDLANAEVSVVAFVASVMVCVVFVVSCECFLIGKITDSSKQMLVTSKNLTSSRRSLYKKFLKSCTQLSLNAAYPFFTIDRDTFVKFMCQYLDFLIQLLVA
ncbi:unnamed protein product [Orchesella dallaii]|uniref:Odorant receptor n=1 Tax=Orchesella dallaii TaxID=48710 RepID=A0ABP1S1R7_9HEXA